MKNVLASIFAVALAFIGISDVAAQGVSTPPFVPDFAFCKNRGAIAVRGAVKWNCIQPGVTDQVLATGGVAGDPYWKTVAGTGSVTSVSVTLPGMFTVTGNPITTSGTISATLASQSANLFFASPDGTSGAPGFRAIVAADLPVVPITKGGTGQTSAATGLDALLNMNYGGLLFRSASGYGAGTVGAVPFPLGTANGGVGCGTPSGTCLDNITGFSGVGIMTRVSAGNYAFTSLSSYIDAQISSTRGGIFYRGVSLWSALAPATATQCLTTGGAGADPAFADCVKDVAAAAGSPFTISGSANGTKTIGDSAGGRANLMLDRMLISKSVAFPYRGVGVFADGFGSNATSYSIGMNYDGVAKTFYNALNATAAAGTTPNSSSSSGPYTFRTTIAQAGLTLTSGSVRTRIFFVPSGGTKGPIYIGPLSGTYGFASAPTQCFFPGGASTGTASAGSYCDANYTLPASGGITISLFSTGAFNYGASPTNWGSYALVTTNDASNQSPTGYNSGAGSTYDVASVSALKYADGGLVPVAQAMPSTINNMRASVILDTSTGSWGTNDTMQISCNGGTNYTAVSGSMIMVTPLGNSGPWLHESAETACGTSGTSALIFYQATGGVNRTVSGYGFTAR